MAATSLIAHLDDPWPDITGRGLDRDAAIGNESRIVNDVITRQGALHLLISNAGTLTVCLSAKIHHRSQT
jgi:hypothetical protein